jgi:hypothetical protein
MLIQFELTRRFEAAQTAHPAKQHQDRISRELVQLQRRAERLLTAYQEELLDRRMPALRQRETRLKAELESLRNQLADQSACLRLAHTLNEFLERLRTQAQTLDVLARQRIVRLIVKEIIVGDDSIAIRHSIPNASRSSGGPAGEPASGMAAPGSGTTTSSLLCTWRDGRALRNAAPLIFGLGCACLPSSVVGLLHGAFQPHLDQMQHARIHDAPRKRQHQFGVRDAPEVVCEVSVHDFTMAANQQLLHLARRLLGIAARPVGVLLGWKVGFEDRFEHQHRCCHAHPIAQGRDAQRPEFAVGFRYEHSSDGVRSVLLVPERKRQFAEPPLHAIRLDIREVLTVPTRCALVGMELFHRGGLANLNEAEGGNAAPLGEDRAR